MFTISKPIVQEVHHPLIRNAGVKLIVLRDDKIHPYISGNKWRKLKYNLVEFRASGKKVMLTFGGAYSNHLIAVAATSALLKIPAVAIVRGDEEFSNDYISFMRTCGMKLVFIPRNDYRLKETPEMLEHIIELVLQRFPTEKFNEDDFYILPEGGSNAAAVKGCMEIVPDLPENTDVIACACGTGATLAGIGLGLHPHQYALGIAVLRGENFLPGKLAAFGVDQSRTKINFDYTFGGYAKGRTKLLPFCADFHAQTGIPLEPVYTGKLFFGLMDLVQKGFFKSGNTIAAIHTGGIFDFSKPLL